MKFPSISGKSHVFKKYLVGHKLVTILSKYLWRAWFTTDYSEVNVTCISSSWSDHCVEHSAWWKWKNETFYFKGKQRQISSKLISQITLHSSLPIYTTCFNDALADPIMWGYAMFFFYSRWEHSIAFSILSLLYMRLITK